MRKKATAAGPWCVDCGVSIQSVGIYFGAGDGTGQRYRCQPCHQGPYVIFCPRCRWTQIFQGPEARELEHYTCTACELDGVSIHYERARTVRYGPAKK